jgi:hypothetical protein
MSRPRVVPTRCKSTGKIKYMSIGAAEWAIQKFEDRTGQAVRSHVFKCEDCGWYHLTRMSGRGENPMVLAHPDRAA